MSLGEATPATGAATKQIKNSSTICTLGSYEKRCLERLLQGACERPHLDRYIGTTNSPEFVRQLRRKGLRIVTGKVRGVNRDGRSVWWGKYTLEQESKVHALKLLGGTNADKV